MADKAMLSAEAKWQAGDPDAALDLLLELSHMLRGYEPPLRLALQILISEHYHPEDVCRILKRLGKLRPLRAREQLILGIHEFRLRKYRAALPLLKAGAATRPEILEQWGYDPENIIQYHLACCDLLGLPRDDSYNAAPDKRSKPEVSGKKPPPASIPSKNKTKSSGSIEVTASNAQPAPLLSPVKPERSNENETLPSQSIPTPSAQTLQTEQSAAVGSALGIIDKFERGEISGLAQYFLGLRAGEFSRAEKYDTLLSLEGLSGIERYSYQHETVRKVLRAFRGRVLLADEVGLGKTIEAGMVLKEYILRNMVKKTLILTPPALVNQWCEELSSKFGLAPVAADGISLRNDTEHFWRNHPLIVASLALARNNRHRPILEQLQFDLIIVDEAHHVKNHRTLGWKLVNALRSRFLLLLSATPVENDLMDLFNLITLLKPGQLGTRAAFRREFVLRGDPTQPQNRERLKGLISEVMIRNTRALADIKLPPRHATTVLVTGETSEQKLYSRLTDLVREGFRRNLMRLSLGSLLQEAGSSPGAVKKTLLKLSSRDDVADDLKTEMIKIAKLCDYIPAVAKTDRLIDLLRSSRQKILVFSQYTATLEDLSKRLSEAEVRFSLFSGGKSAAEKDAAVEAFRNGTDVMLCSEIGGEGRNLQFCSTIVNYDLPWNPMKIEQRIGRIHRIGQQQPVYVYNLCAQNTAEHHILEVLDKRLNLFELVIGEVDLILGQLKNEQEFEERILEIYGKSQNEVDVATAFDQLGEELLSARSQYEKIRKLDAEIFCNDYEI